MLDRERACSRRRALRLAPARGNTCRMALLLRTSSSLVCEKSSYQAPTAPKRSGVRRQTTSSASEPSARHTSGSAPATAAITLSRVIEPDRPDSRQHSRPRREAVVHQDHGAIGQIRRRSVAPKEALTALKLSPLASVDRLDPLRRKRKRVQQLLVQDAHAAGRDRPERELLVTRHPSLRTRNTSSGASSACAISNATGTPPRGSPSTTTSARPANPRSLSASRRPASDRSMKRRLSISGGGRADGDEPKPFLSVISRCVYSYARSFSFIRPGGAAPAGVRLKLRGSS